MKLVKIIAVLAVIASLSSCSLRKVEPQTPSETENIPQPTQEVQQPEPVKTVCIGSAEFEADVGNITLESGLYGFEDLMEGIAQFDSLAVVSLPHISLTFEQLDTLWQTYPAIDFEYTVDLYGKEYAHNIEELDLSGLVPEQIDEAVQKLRMFPELRNVELMDKSGVCQLSVNDVRMLNAGVPGADFHYVFELFGKTVSTTDERIEFVDQKIGNDGEETIRAALDIMCDGTYVKFDDCGIDSEIMALIRSDYPNMTVVWRVHCGYFSLLTDEETVRAIFDLNDKNCHELKYCTEVKYMDIGHNDKLTDISFIAYMPKLEILILSGSPFTDMTPFANCPNLEWFEIVWCGHVTDISPLANCPNLKYVNISYTKVTDLSCLADKPLERFVYYTPKVNVEQQAEFNELHPDCWVSFGGKNPYMKGWRYDDDAGGMPCEMYSKVREVFRYDENFYNHKGA